MEMEVCGEMLHFYIAVSQSCLSWLQTERHPGLLQPDSQSVCADVPRWSALTLMVAYLEAFATSTRNAPGVIREDICNGFSILR